MAKKKTEKASAKPAAKPAAKPKAAKPAAAGRPKWFDDASHEPLIDDYARQLDSFLQTMADGVVDENEIKAQEVRLVGLMKEIEPLLDDALHATVTRLLCELTAYDIMQMLHSLQASRPRPQLRL
jgi:hypothetical protein